MIHSSQIIAKFYKSLVIYNFKRKLKNMTQNKNIKYGKKKGGFSLMEILFVLAIVAGLVIAAVTLYNQNQNTSNAKVIAQDIQAMSSGIKTSYSGDQTGFTDVNVTNVINLGILPKTLTYTPGGSTIKNKYSGAVTFSLAQAVDGVVPAFSIKEDNLPRDVISKVLSQLGTEGMVAMSVNDKCIFSTGAEGANLAATDCSNVTPYSTATLAAAIASGSTNGNIVIAYGQ